MTVSWVALTLLLQPTYQPNRYDMGVRLQLVDQAWLKASPKAKEAAVPMMSNAVSGFFGGKPGDVCKALDEARAKLLGEPVNPLWALTFRPEQPRFDGKETPSFVGNWTYKPTGPLPTGFEFGVPVNIKPESPLTRGVREMVSKGFLMPSGQIVFAHQFSDWGSTKAKLENMQSREAAFIAERALKQLEAGETGSSSQPLASWIETALTVEKEGLEFASELPIVRHEGSEFRVAFPGKLKENPGVMIALHGAGGEADMFFDSYGAGIWGKKALQKGMIFVSPNTSAKAPSAALKWLKEVRGITPGRVILVGHSMGGGAAISAASSLDPKPSALILLAPAAGALPPSIAAVPTLLCVGENEMMMLKNMATRMEEAVEKTPGGKSMKIKNAEHLMVVAEAVEPAFDWLDNILK